MNNSEVAFNALHENIAAPKRTLRFEVHGQMHELLKPGGLEAFERRCREHLESELLRLRHSVEGTVGDTKVPAADLDLRIQRERRPGMEAGTQATLVQAWPSKGLKPQEHKDTSSELAKTNERMDPDLAVADAVANAKLHLALLRLASENVARKILQNPAAIDPKTLTLLRAFSDSAAVQETNLLRAAETLRKLRQDNAGPLPNVEDVRLADDHKVSSIPPMDEVDRMLINSMMDKVFGMIELEKRLMKMEKESSPEGNR